jgi:hypothetical protein
MFSGRLRKNEASSSSLELTLGDGASRPKSSPNPQSHAGDPNNNALDPQLRDRKGKVPFGEGWLWEVFSAVFSAACIVAMIVFLRILDHQRVPSWASSVSPNAIISVASTASKAAMILAIAEGIGQLKWLHLKAERHRYVVPHEQASKC